MFAMQFPPNAYELIALIMFIAIMLYLIVEPMLKKPKKPEYITRELVQCEKCGYREEKDYRLGDYVGLEYGKCPKCGGPTRVAGIYSVEKKKAFKPLT